MSIPARQEAYYLTSLSFSCDIQLKRHKQPLDSEYASKLLSSDASTAQTVTGKECSAAQQPPTPISTVLRSTGMVHKGHGTPLQSVVVDGRSENPP